MNILTKPLSSPFPSTIVRDSYLALKQLLNCLQRPPWLDPTTKTLKVATVTVSTVSTVTNITNIGALSAVYHIVYPTMRNNWIQSVRNRIT